MRRTCQFVFMGFSLLWAHGNAGAQVSFSTVVDMALRNSTAVRRAAADVEHAEAAVMETVGAYKPSFSVGSSLGYSYGFPVGQPSIYSVSAQSLAFSFSQPDYIRSSRAALVAAQLQLKDARQQVILAAALDYVELATVSQQMTALDQQTGFVRRLVEIENERVDAGLDSKVERTQARLTAAQVALRRLHLQNQAEMARDRLGHLTGLNAGDMVADAKTVPGAPLVTEQGVFPGLIKETNSGVKAAYASAQAKLYTAFGDARQNDRPTFVFGGEYNRYAKFNNYSQYYLRFQHNNFNVGIQISLPLFDATRKARAKGSSAEAAQAKAQADQLRDQAGEQMLQLQKSIAELAAQEEVAELQNELAQEQLDTISTQLRLGAGGQGGGTPLPKDEQAALIGERSRYIDMLETRFQLTQARLSLLRSTGGMEEWAKGTPGP